MAEIHVSGATGILNTLVGVVAREIGSAWGVQDDLKKLQKTLQMILAVIADAERKQLSDEAVRLWLRWIKDVAYDADDVMDEFAYETMRRCEREDILKQKVLKFVSSSNPLAFRFKMASKIKNINRRLDEITKKMHGFQFQITASFSDDESSDPERSRYTTSVSSETDIVGRGEDKSNVISILTNVPPSTSGRNPENVSAVSLVGMGGLGKTTLAQLIYTDKFIKTQFELTMWVHVSQSFDVENLLINIMESATETKFDKLSNFDVLVKKVQEYLRGKKYLLVLDDLWNEDHEQWDRLKSLLLVGAQGSKILITTRKDQVAAIVSGTIPPYNLKHLSDDVCWSMIKKRAFSPGGALHTQEMEDIGKEIARKCCGLPLAAKFLGSLLHSKNKKSDWISIRDDDIWNTHGKILPTLRLSYNNLPSHLKQCFSFCTIFPKNWVINKETVVQLWMAEGFLKPENKRPIEDVGNEYFESLLWSSFFHYPQKNELGDVEQCQMHDLVHDLANDVLGDKELVSLKAGELKDVSEVRRVQLNLDDEDISTIFLKGLSNARKLRSVFVPQGCNLNPTTFSRNKHLRVLYVGNSGDYATLRLPHLRLKLKHLRYLHLTTLNFSEAVNDRSISELYNLETLVLKKIVGIQNLLTNIQCLKKLRHLHISCSKIEELPDSVTSLPDLQSLNLSHCELKSLPDSATGLKQLRFLDMSSNRLIEELPSFVTGLRNLEILNVSYCSKLKAIPESVTSLINLKVFNFTQCPLLEALPEDFGALTQLRYLSIQGTAIKVLPDSCADLINLEVLYLLGTCEPPKEDLSIHCLENVRWIADAKTANLKGKQNLRDLELHWGLPEDRSIELLEALQPPTGLRKLTIGHYRGVNFPAWVSDPSCLPNLEIMILDGCSSMKRLPEAIGQLSSLRSLELTNMSFRRLDVEFPFLTQLKLNYHLLLKELCYSYPCLQSLIIASCSSLIKIPMFPSLAVLDLYDVDHTLVRSFERRCTSLTTLRLVDVKDFEFFPLHILQNNRSLKDIFIMWCNQLQGFRVNDDGNENEISRFGTEMIQHDSVQTFVVTDCPVLKFLPDFRGWTSLQSLTIYECPKVKESLSSDLKSLPGLLSLRVDFIQRDEHRGDPSDFRDLINLLD